MKFAQKLSLAMILLLAASFSLGGYFMVRQNFQDALKTVLVQNEAQHAMECYALQTEILSAMAKGEQQADDAALTASFEALTAHAPDKHVSTLYGENGTVVATNAPQKIDAKLLQSDSYQLIKQGGNVLMVLSTELVSPTRALWLQNAYDVSPLFTTRTRQIGRLWEMEIITLLLSGALIVWLSVRLTRPVSELSKASSLIADSTESINSLISRIENSCRAQREASVQSRKTVESMTVTTTSTIGNIKALEAQAAQLGRQVALLNKEI